MSRIVTALEAALVSAISLCWSAISHNGMVTCHNTNSGNHKTYRIFTVRECHIRRADRLHARQRSVRKAEWKRFPEYMLGKRVAQVLTGPDRSTFGDWFTFGYVTDQGVGVFRKLQGEKGQPSRYDWSAKLLNDREFGASRGVHYHIEGRCSKCNRPISHPSSIYPGIGPVCRGESNRRVVVDYSTLNEAQREAIAEYEQLFEAQANAEQQQAEMDAERRNEEALDSLR